MAVVSILCSVSEAEEGAQLFRVDLAGSFFGYTACAAGVKEQEATSLFEKRASPGASLDQTLQTAIEVLQTCVGADFRPSEVEVGVIEMNPGDEFGVFRILKEDEIERVLVEIAEKD